MIETIKAGFSFGNQQLFEADRPLANIVLKTDEQMPLDVSSLAMKSRGRFVPGMHELILTDRAVKIEVRPETEFEIELYCADNPKKLLSAEKVNLKLTKPVRIINILTTLDELSTLIAPTIRKDKNNKDNTDEVRDENEESFSERIKKSEFFTKAGDFIGKKADVIRKTESFKKAGDFWEKNASPYIDKIADSKGWKKIVETAEKTSEKAIEMSPVALEKSREFLNRVLEFGEEKMDSVIDGFSVSEIEIVAQPKRDTKRLSLFITGEIVVSEKRRIPMEHLELPGILLTRFDAELQNLLAQFCVTSEQGSSLSKTFLGMLEHLDGAFLLDFEFTPFAFALLGRAGRFCSFGIDANRKSHAKIRVQADRNSDEISIHFKAVIENHEEETVTASIDLTTRDDQLIACGEKLALHEWTLSLIGEGDDIHGHIEIEEGSRIFPNAVEVVAHEPRLKSDLRMPLKMSSVPLKGRMDFGVRAENTTLYVQTLDLEMTGNVAWDKSVPLDFDKLHSEFSKCDGEFDLKITKESGGLIATDLTADLDFGVHSVIPVQSIPEFKLLDRECRTELAGQMKARLHGEVQTHRMSALSLDLGKSKCELSLSDGRIQRDKYAVMIDTPLVIGCDLRKISLDSDGLGESILGLSWASEKSPILCVDQEQHPVFRHYSGAGHITVNISEQGMVLFSEGEGFYDENFLNFVLYPQFGKSKAVEIFSYRPLLENLEHLAHVIGRTPDSFLVKAAQRVREWVERCASKGIPIDSNHASSMAWLARIVSAFLFEGDEHVPEIEKILRNAVQAKGLDRFRVEALIEEAFPGYDLSQLGQILKIADRIFKGVIFDEPEVTHSESRYDEYAHHFRILPSANQLFDLDTVSKDDFKKYYKYGGPCLIDTPATRARIIKYSAGYTVAQLSWILEKHGELFTETQRLKLERLIAIKKRILKQEPSEGSFVVQDFNIDYFLQSILDAEEETLPHISDISECLDDFTERCVSDDIVECFASWVTPEDIGRLLSAGIASRIQGQLVQLNQVRLLEYLVKRGKTFALATFYEACAGSDRILVSYFVNLLNLDLSLLKEPMDTVRVLSDLLGMEMPVKAEYMPGGCHSADSYFERLYTIAHEINTSTTEYIAAKLRMRSDRIATDEFIQEETPKRPPYQPKFPDEDELAELSRAIEKADNASEQLISDVENGRECDGQILSKLARNYDYAYRLASSVLQKYPDAFQKPVFKKFYARTYEALLIQTLDQNLVDDVDQVRHWFAVRSGIAMDEIAGLSRTKRRLAVIDVMYYRESDREVRRRDPLTWVDIRPGEGQIDLTILFTPGVITDGRSGHELGTAFERLKRTRGVQIVRSDTGNVKSLAFNARIIEEDIRKIKTPYMLLGYSQGCANVMRAESNLYASTPEDRACLDRMVARHFIFSALNGSLHANCGGEIYRRSLISGEKCLKSMSAVSSVALGNMIFRVLRNIMDSPLYTMSLNSVESLSYNGLMELSLDAQYKTSVVSTELQGVIEEFIPEILDYMYYHYLAQAGKGVCLENDSQVGTKCAHAYHVYNRNDSVDLLREEAVPTCTLKIHHWAPIYQEVAFVETPQDAENAVFRFPKDIHVMPAVEALILFGIVPLKH